eukprot:gene9207-16883_t
MEYDDTDDMWLWPVKIEKIETTRDQRANGSSKGEKTNSDVKYEKSKSELLYNIEENPPWHLAVGLGFQTAADDLRRSATVCGTFPVKVFPYNLKTAADDLRRSATICDDLRRSATICDDLRRFATICDDPA